MPDNLQLNVKVAVNAKGFKAQLEAIKRALDKLRGATKEAGDAADEAGKEIDGMGNALDKIGGGGLPPGVARVGKDADAARRKVKGLNSSLGTLARRLGAIAVGYLGFRAVQGLGRQIDAYTELNNRIRLVADSEAELAGIRDKLFAISLKTRSSIAANAQLYSRLAQASKDLGTSQADLLKVTEVLNKQVLIGGNNASEAAAGLVQFAQGVASGRLQGDELRSVMENLLGVQQGLIDGFKILHETGQIDFQVTRANLRKLASEGVLDADLLLKALLAVADKTEERFEQVTVTIGGAFQNLFTAIFGRLGLIEEGAGAGGFVAGLVQAGANFIKPATESEKRLERIAEQLRRGSLSPDALGQEALAGLLERSRAALERLRAAPGSYYGGGAGNYNRIRELEQEVALYERLAKQKAKQIELNKRLAPPGALTYLKRSEASATIGARLRTEEERIEAEHERDRARLEKDLQAARVREAALRQRLNTLRQTQAAGRLQDFGQDIEVARNSLQKQVDEVAGLNQDLARLEDERERKLANTATARAARAKQDREAAEAAAARAKQEREAAEARRRLEAEREKQAAKAKAALESLDERERGFLNPFERERAELRKWAKETEAALRANEKAYAQHRERLEGVVAKSLDDIAKREREAQREAVEERINNSRAAAVGLLRAAEEYGREATNAAKHAEEAFEKAFGNIEHQLVRLLTKGKFSLKQFGRDLAADLARATVRIGLTGPVATSLGTALRGRLGLTAPATAKDAVDQLNTDLMDTQRQIIAAGDDSAKKLNDLVTAGGKEFAELQSQTALLKRIADCSCGADQRLQQLQQFRAGGDGGGGGLLRDVLGQVIAHSVQRFHSGGVVPGRPGQEVLGLLEGGETVLPRAARAARVGGAPQQVQVVVENRGANQQEAVEQRAEADGEKLIVSVVMDDVARRGPLSRGLERTYGLGRRTA